MNFASAPRNRGFSLVEMLTTICVLSILAVIAVPSFAEMRQRAAIRGAADATLAFWNDARFEAIKRNRLVKVGVYVADDGQFCLGAATTEDPADATVCDCSSATPATVTASLRVCGRPNACGCGELAGRRHVRW